VFWGVQVLGESAWRGVVMTFQGVFSSTIVRYASHPIASNSANDSVTLPAFDALAQHLNEKEAQ
jgi:hypothetical protein